MKFLIILLLILFLLAMLVFIFCALQITPNEMEDEIKKTDYNEEDVIDD